MITGSDTCGVLPTLCLNVRRDFWGVPGEPLLVHGGPDAGQGGPSYRPIGNAALSPYLEKGPMLNSKICRQHAAKCIETAETIPPGAQREMFFDMAKRWTDLAINIESSEALADPASPPANDPGEPYRFGSRFTKAPTC